MNTDFDTTGLAPHQVHFYHWILEREKCRKGRESNGTIIKPWSTDPILQSYRFCNVRREDDTVTKWIHENWIQGYQHRVDAKRMVLAMIIARTINRVETLKAIGFPLNGFNDYLENARVILKNRRAAKQPVWTGAYLVSTNGHQMDKIDYILDKVWAPFEFKGRAPDIGETLAHYHAYLMNFDGLGSFMAGQVIADLKFTRWLYKAKDWLFWAPIGPGSKRGLNRYFGRPIEAAIKSTQVQEELLGVQLQVHSRLDLTLAVHNIQNVMCEYDKYMRVLLGEGAPRSTYSGKI